MNIKALATLLVLGSSSLALAQPSFDGTPEVRDHRYIAPAPAPAPIVNDNHWSHRPMLPKWMTLDASAKIGRSGRDYVQIAPSSLRTLKLQATSGKTVVTQIAIRFANGRSQIVYPNQTLDARNPSLVVDLDGVKRTVVGITVFGSSRRGTFEILGA